MTEQVARIYLGEALQQAPEQADVLVLACTHYPLIAPLLRRIAPAHIQIVDSAESTARAVKKIVDQHPTLSPNAGYKGGIAAGEMLNDGSDQSHRVSSQARSGGNPPVILSENGNNQPVILSGERLPLAAAERSRRTLIEARVSSRRASHLPLLRHRLHRQVQTPGHALLRAPGGQCRARGPGRMTELAIRNSPFALRLIRVMRCGTAQ